MNVEMSHDTLSASDLADLRSIEPWWKLILGNKALLPLLWTMYPNHPGILPAFYSHPKGELAGLNINYADKMWVSKPLFGREGAGVFVSHNFTRYDDFVRLTVRNFGTKGGRPMGHSIYQ